MISAQCSKPRKGEGKKGAPRKKVNHAACTARDCLCPCHFVIGTNGESLLTDS